MSLYTETTVKLDAAVVKEVKESLAPGATLTSYVREVIQKDLKRSKMKASARAYAEFLQMNPEEATEMEGWANADLTLAPRQSK